MYPNTPNQQPPVKDVWADDTVESNQPPIDLLKPLPGELPIAKPASSHKKVWIIITVALVFLGLMTILAVALASMEKSERTTEVTADDSSSSSGDSESLGWETFTVEGWTLATEQDDQTATKKYTNNSQILTLSVAPKDAAYNGLPDSDAADRYLDNRLDELSSAGKTDPLARSEVLISDLSDKKFAFKVSPVVYKQNPKPSTRRVDAVRVANNKILLASYETPESEWQERQWKSIIENIHITTIIGG